MLFPAALLVPSSEALSKLASSPIHSSGVGTLVDPTLCRADRLVGQVLGAVGSLPEIFIIIEISFFLLRRLLGVRTEGDQEAAKVRGESGNLFDIERNRRFARSQNLPKAKTSWSTLARCRQVAKSSL